MCLAVVRWCHVDYGKDMWQFNFQNHPKAGRYYHYARRQPGWIVKIAIATAGMVILLPLITVVLLLIAAVIVGVAVFLVLTILMSIVTLPYRLFQAMFHRQQETEADRGRVNVVVMPPDHR